MRQWISSGATILMSLTKLWPTRLRARKLVSLIRSRENFTSSAEKAVPSCHFTSVRSLIFQVRPSADRPPFSRVGSCDKPTITCPRGLLGGLVGRAACAKTEAGLARPAAAPAARTITVRLLGTPEVDPRHAETPDLPASSDMISLHLCARGI